MTHSLLVLASFVIGLVAYVYHIIRLIRAPCAHPTSSLNPLWILWIRYRGSEQEIAAVTAAHHRHGPIVRLGPREISVASFDIEVRRELSQGKLWKPGWYSPFSNHGRQNCMSSLDPHSHSRRRRRVMQPYLKGQLQTSKQLHSIMVTVLRDRLSPRLLPSLNSNVVVVNAMSLCFATVMDVVSGYAFGLDTALDLTGNPKKCLSYQKLYREASAQTWMFWAQELPVVSRFFPSTTQTRKARSFLEADVLSMCTSVEDNRSESTDCSEFDSLQRASLQHFSGGEDDREGFASEMLDHLKATSDVLSVTLAQALYELSKNQLAQLQLRSELQGLCGLQNWETRWLPSAMDLDALPFLDAVVCEALRLRPTLPDGQPRVSLPTGVNLLGVHVPANVRISMYPYIMHHDGTIFTDPYIWNPHRWMSTEIDRNMHLWAFGVGARACLGKHMTMLVMKKVLAFVYTFYDTNVHDDSGWQKRGQFVNVDDVLELSFARIV